MQFATVEDEPSYPSVGRFTLVGMIVGIVLGIIVVTWVYLLDDAIKDRDYLEKTFDIPVLAYIPEYTTVKSTSEESAEKKENE